MKLILIILTASIGGLILLEIGLRLLLGLGNPVLYLADREIGYLLAPQQKVRRFGNLIEINQYSLRNSAIEKQRPKDTLRVLLLGDSIVNGGWWTDQQSTISHLLETQLSQEVTAEVLNAAANSWGPRNQLAYVQKLGTFEAQYIILLLNTDDLFALAPNSAVVGRDHHYPNRRPPLAIMELLQRFLPQSPVPSVKEPGDRVGFNLQAIAQIQDLGEQNQAQLLLGITPLLRETTQSGSRDYEQQARQRLAEFLAEAQVPYVDFLPVFQATDSPADLYRDHIHLSLLGNKLVVEKLRELLPN